MSGSVVASKGGVTVGLDRGGGALVMICERHRVMKAVHLSRSDLASLLLEFIDRHEGCTQRELTMHLGS